jgi:low affinity Fe/Cu permease
MNLILKHNIIILLCMYVFISQLAFGGKKASIEGTYSSELSGNVQALEDKNVERRSDSIRSTTQKQSIAPSKSVLTSIRQISIVELIILIIILITVFIIGTFLLWKQTKLIKLGKHNAEGINSSLRNLNDIIVKLNDQIRSSNINSKKLIDLESKNEDMASKLSDRINDIANDLRIVSEEKLMIDRQHGLFELQKSISIVIDMLQARTDDEIPILVTDDETRGTEETSLRPTESGDTAALDSTGEEKQDYLEKWLSSDE